MNDIELAKQWIIEHELINNPDHSAYTASASLEDLVRNDPARAFKVVRLIVLNTDDKTVLANVGAGPLEDLINSDSAAQIVDDILEHARQDESWRFALGCVRPRNTNDKEMYKRVAEAIKLYFPEGTP
jgi:hypothetical protein